MPILVEVMATTQNPYKIHQQFKKFGCYPNLLCFYKTWHEKGWTPPWISTSSTWKVVWEVMDRMVHFLATVSMYLSSIGRMTKNNNGSPNHIAL